MASSSSRPLKSKQEFDVFISYNWSIKSEILQLSTKLVESNFKVWEDGTDLNNKNSAFTEQLAEAIKNSKLFLCCLNKNYCESRNCTREFNYANDIGKPMIILLIENLKKEEMDGMGFMIHDKFRINCYKNPKTWFYDDFEDIKKSILKK